ncbi:hypothetical protein AB0G02_03670 [Actinosynnema sp. NPDC023658]|uniref:hypothetical protein n=1 Tax=Actinosynnema sp. NPDC023658 TaxID=3155465 RepID=UPI00340DC49D
MSCDRGPVVKRHPGFRPRPVFRKCRPELLSDLVLAELSAHFPPAPGDRVGGRRLLVEAAREVLAGRRTAPEEEGDRERPR